MSVTWYYEGSDVKRWVFDQEVDDDRGNPVQHGQCIKYWRNGKKAAEGVMQAGRPHGSWIFWYPTGIIEAECSFVNGKEHGQYFRYHPTGPIAVSGTNNLGKKTGVWTYWDREGNATEAVYAEAEAD